MTGQPYVILAAVLVGSGLLLAVAGGDRSIIAVLLLLGCLCAIAALTGDDKGRR